MHQPSIRTALGRTSRGLLSTTGYAATTISGTRGPLSVTTTAFFSTTPSRAADNDKGDRQNRLAAAASAVSSLNNDSKSSSSSSSQEPLPARRAPISSSESGAQVGGRGGGIINIRSLPRKLTGGPPRFAGSVGFSDPNAKPNPHFSQDPSAAAPRVITNPLFSATGSDGHQGRGGGMSSGRRGGGGGGGRNRKRRSRDDGEGQEDRGKQSNSNEFPYTPEMQEFFLKESLGEYSDFEPALTLAGLKSYRPAVASSQTAAGGNVSMALREMRVLGGGHAFGGDQEQGATKLTVVPNMHGLVERLHKGESVYFDSAMERAMVDKALASRTVRNFIRKNSLSYDSMIQEPSKATKDAVLETAIRGVYEKKGTVAHSAVMETLQRYQDKDYTYTEEHKRQFAAKIQELLPEAAGKAAKVAKA